MMPHITPTPMRTSWRSLTAAAAPISVDDDGTWTGPITWMRTWSADRRMLAAYDEIPVRPLPLPVAVQWHLDDGHRGAEVGLMSLDEVWGEGDAVIGRGRIDMDDPNGPRLARKIRHGFLRFVSADVDDVDRGEVCVGEDGQVLADCDPAEQAGDGGEVGELWHQWRIMGATVLAHPAFPQAAITLDGEGTLQEQEAEPTDPAAPSAEADAPTVAGLAVLAADTGRVLMLQRALVEGDPAAGRWEFPSGHIEGDEDPQAAAVREFQEETGTTLPDSAEFITSWDSPDGVYRGFAATVPTERELAINLDPEDRAVLNPDDPDGDQIETLAWFTLAELPDMPGLREEVRATPWQLLAQAAGGQAEAAEPSAVDAINASSDALALDADLPWAPRDRAWDAGAARARLAAWASSDGSGDKDTIDWNKYGAGFLVTPDTDGEDTPNLGAFKLPVVDVINGELQLVWRGVVGARGALSGARSPLNVTDEKRRQAEAAVTELYEAAAVAFDDPSIGTDEPDEEEREDELTSTAALPHCVSLQTLAASAFAHPNFAPPTDWFRDPQLPGPTLTQITEDGRVIGHLALWGVPHVSYQGKKIYAPPSPTGYERFHARPIHTSDGIVEVGVLAFATRHAPTWAGAQEALVHYDSTGSIAAAVRCGEDAFGIWMTGALLPDVERDSDQRLRLSLADFSGDWRDEGAGLDLKAALAVPTGHEGFYTRKHAPASREGYALIASGAVTAEHIEAARTATPETRPAPLATGIPADRGVEQEQRAETQRRLAAADGSVRALRVRMAGRQIRQLKVMTLAASAAELKSRFIEQ